MNNFLENGIKKEEISQVMNFVGGWIIVITVVVYNV